MISLCEIKIHTAYSVLCLKEHRKRWHCDTDKWQSQVQICCRCSLWSSWTPVCRRFRRHMNAFCLCGRLYVVTLLFMFHKTGLKIKSREHEAKKDVPAVYLSSAAGWRPWPDLCIAPSNSSVNMRVQCRWRGGGHTVRGKWGERPVYKQSLYASKSKTSIYWGVNVTGCGAKKKHFIDCLPPLFTSLPPALSTSPRKRGHCHQWASLWLQQRVMCASGAFKAELVQVLGQIGMLCACTHAREHAHTHTPKVHHCSKKNLLKRSITILKTKIHCQTTD